MNVIELKDVLNLMHSCDSRGNPYPFDIEYISLDMTRDKGGDIVKHSNAVLLVKPDKRINASQRVADIVKKRKDANHHLNLTRNIKLANGEIRKIHPHLIRKFNDQKVVWSITG